MIVQEILEEVVTLPEAATIATNMGYNLDRSNLLRYAQGGAARGSQERGHLVDDTFCFAGAHP